MKGQTSVPPSPLRGSGHHLPPPQGLGRSCLSLCPSAGPLQHLPTTPESVNCSPGPPSLLGLRLEGSGAKPGVPCEGLGLGASHLPRIP